jgi:hypothetical protein
MENVGKIRYHYLHAAVFALESSHPEVVAKMVALAAPFHTVRSDGTACSSNSGTVHWFPRSAPPLTETFDSYTNTAPSAVSMVVTNGDSITTFLKPYCDVLPKAILELVSDDPSSAIASSYRRHIRTAFLPAMQRVAEILRAHESTMEWCDCDVAPSSSIAVRELAAFCHMNFQAVCVTKIRAHNSRTHLLDLCRPPISWLRYTCAS